MTKRLTDLTNTSISEADIMYINMNKTVSQYVHKRKPIEVTKEEITSADNMITVLQTKIENNVGDADVNKINEN